MFLRQLGRNPSRALLRRCLLPATAPAAGLGLPAAGPRMLSGSSALRTKVANPHLSGLHSDYLYHLGLSSDDVKEGFGDVRFFCTGGSPGRMEAFANLVADELELAPLGLRPQPIGKTDRFCTYKVGPVLISSHGMGQPSYSILLHEASKLFNYAGAKDVVYFRMGSSGGVGVEPGTVVVTTEAMDGTIQPRYTLPVLGEPRSWPTVIDQSLVDELVALEHPNVAVGRTMAADCFYEGQGRLDGALCDYTEADKMEFLERLSAAGVKNIEMEAGFFASFCQRLGIRGAVACVTLLNRLDGDQVLSSMETLMEYDERPAHLVVKYIKSVLANDI